MAGKVQGRLGAAFRPPTAEKPLGAAFREGPKAEMPSIVVIHPLHLLRDLAVRRGWPSTEPDVNRALAAARAEGELDLSKIEARYGPGAWEKTPMIILPPLEGAEVGPGVFRAVSERGRLVLYPPEG
jgi:hypothetical protein